ncbi:hypothetical protein SNOG_14132 [Parastagonospora nodorum SN15]|uniref:Aminoglycoside phosphotransferase domain-containing protein n=1 Tax=Phaeosphaeria nodorum (strain SN15 / ATCC MYA-4574 / FGSC 10173) TaxID=321614 RepID=Q0U1W7_PHANO|nr:hypothetical protein SNOG_14132 [Parastagonospora nodorum SN15]EAT78369.2 hypothetical protein SNOG_14132 [Parastagonospora nodorum SN15]
MKCFWKMSSLRNVINLFKRSDIDDDDHRYDEEPSKHTSLPIISGPEAEQEHEDENNGPIVDTKLETGSVDTPDAFIPEVHEELQELKRLEIESLQNNTSDIDINDTIAGSAEQDVESELDEVNAASGVAIKETDVDSVEEDPAPVTAAPRVHHGVYDHDATSAAPISECETELEDHDTSSVAFGNEVGDETVSLPPAKGITQDGDDIDAGPTDTICATEEEQTPAVSNSSDDHDDPNAIDPEILRADWAPLLAIPSDLFCSTLLQHLPAAHAITLADIQSVDKIQGGNNFVRILEITHGPSADLYVIKVPSVGTAARWQDSDAYMLRNDARTMLYIRKHTDVPSPEVLGWSDKLDSKLGAPYILMRANKVVPASSIWFEQDDKGEDDVTNAGLPGTARMDIRLTFLRSLAAQMAKLQTLTFDAAGTLDFDDDEEKPTIGPTYHWKTVSEMAELSEDDMGTPASITRVPAFPSSTEYFSSALEHHWPLRTDTFGALSNGRRFIMQAILSSPPFCPSPSNTDNKESFTLRHPDLDFQNILCAPSGHVTGLIDWDTARSAPRCLGFCALPVFLTRDWAPGFEVDAEMHMPWELTEYRGVYARAMLAASPDGKFTAKSAVYEACNATLYGGTLGGSVGGFCEKGIGGSWRARGGWRMWMSCGISGRGGRLER